VKATRLHNVSAQTQLVQVALPCLSLPRNPWRDLVAGQEYLVSAHGLSIPVPPYTVRWLKAWLQNTTQ
jgi:hypothetical protein